ncbi:MAG: hypothetical protein M0Q90_06000 [Bacteroidales bacterium]|nr:hypothetical protein [Bacteroidales bacterium]
MGKSIFINFENQMIKRILIISICVILFVGCDSPNQVRQAKSEADKLLNDISLGNAYSAFSEKYFPAEQTVALINELKNECDFANRKGVFINDYIQATTDGKRVSFIYEYYLKCDNIRFIITYKLGKEVELYEFNLEPIEKDNPMITSPERQLKY